MMIRKYKDLLKEVEEEHKNADNLHRDSRVLVVDGTNLFIRVFSAIPTLNEDGQHVGGLSGFMKSLGATIRMVKPTRVVVVFDGKGGSHRRRKIFDNYKERRAIKSRLNRAVGFEDLADEQASMKFQMVRLYEYLQNLPLTTIVVDHIEADDVIAYLASYFKEKIYILSNDRDFLQLVSENVNVYVPTQKKMFNQENLLEQYSVWSENFTIFKALLGDNSDSIPGIKGMGEKTILKHFPELGERKKIGLDEFIQICESYDGKAKAMLELKQSIPQLKRNYELMQLLDVDIPASTKSNIRNMVDGEISSMNKIQLDTLCLQDKLRAVMNGWDDWLSTNFKSLDSYRTKTME
jgi:DNA polymerase-1